MSEVKVDTISERTAANGVAVDGVTIKDSGLTIPSGGTLTVASGGTITNSGTATGFGEVLTDFCRISAQSTFTSLTNNVLVTLAFDTEDWDVHGSMANLTNNRIDIKNAGYYVVGGRLTIGSDNANESRYLYINQYDDSAATTISGIARQAIVQTSHSAAQFLSCMSIVYLAVDDYLTMQGFSNGGGGPSTLNYDMFCGRLK